jgi:hypothetical protein
MVQPIKRLFPIFNIDPKKIFWTRDIDEGNIYSAIDGKVFVDPTNIAKLKKYSLVIADLSSDHWGADGGTINMVYDILENNGINFIVLSHEPTDHQLRPNLYFCPSWYHVTKERYVIPDRVILNSDRTYKVSCLGGNARNHRIYNYLQFKNKPYAQNSLVTMYKTVKTRQDDVELDEITLTQWSMIKDSLESWNNTGLPMDDHPAWFDTYINIIGESTVCNRVFLSEKTWKPISSGQLFVMFGNPGSITHLRDLGVDVFDDIIDHKYYDTELDWKTRLEKLYTVVDSLVNQDLAVIYKQTQDRRLNNKQNFLAGNFDQKYYNQIMDLCINTQN